MIDYAQENISLCIMLAVAYTDKAYGAIQEPLRFLSYQRDETL